MEFYVLFTIIIASLLIIGVYQIRQQHKTLQQKQSQVHDFLNKFDAFGNSLHEGSFNADLYTWLTRRVTRIQEIAGWQGVLAIYVKPYTRDVLYNYQVLINILPDLRRGVGDEQTLVHMLMTCQDVLFRLTGTLQDEVEQLRSEGTNPFIWLREGVRFVVTLPLRLLWWSGLMSANRFEQAESSLTVKMITFLVGAIGLLASIIQIVLAWEPLMAFVGLR